MHTEAHDRFMVMKIIQQVKYTSVIGVTYSETITKIIISSINIVSSDEIYHRFIDQFNILYNKLTIQCQLQTHH